MTERNQLKMVNAVLAFVSFAFIFCLYALWRQRYEYDLICIWSNICCLASMLILRGYLQRRIAKSEECDIT